MNGLELGFKTSWKMMTRDKGWIKPLLVLALVSWIPILGTIAVLGYGLEWARLTAWGVESTPKQRKVDYGKMLVTGGIAFLVSFTINLVVQLISFLITGELDLLSTVYTSSITMVGASAVLGASTVWSLVSTVIDLLLGTFITAACMRSTIYDSFSAGWRLDRIFQMIVRDFGGFMHAYAVSLLGGLIVWAVSTLVSLLGVTLAIGALMPVLYIYGSSTSSSYAIVEYLVNICTQNPLMVLLVIVVVILVAFTIDVMSVGAQLISINAMGQWFYRFDVDRWGVSSAPLPDGVPHKNKAHQPAGGGTPNVPPEAEQARSSHVPYDVAPEQSQPFAAGDPEPAVSTDTPDMGQVTDHEPVVSPAGADEAAEPEKAKEPIPLPPISDDDTHPNGQDET